MQWQYNDQQKEYIVYVLVCRLYQVHNHLELKCTYNEQRTANKFISSSLIYKITKMIPEPGNPCQEWLNMHPYPYNFPVVMIKNREWM